MVRVERRGIASPVTNDDVGVAEAGESNDPAVFELEPDVDWNGIAIGADEGVMLKYDICEGGGLSE